MPFLEKLSYLYASLKRFSGPETELSSPVGVRADFRLWD